MIHVGKAYNRKFKKRKNNVYTLIPKEFWKKPPNEDDNQDNDCNESRGTRETISMESKIPYEGTENTSNNTHIIRIIEE